MSECLLLFFGDVKSSYRPHLEAKKTGLGLGLVTTGLVLGLVALVASTSYSLAA